MIAAHDVTISTEWALMGVLAVLGTSIVASLLKPKTEPVA